MVGVAAITGTAAQLLMGTIVDIAKVQFAVEDFEAVEGLPESVFATEGFVFCNDLLFSGIFFCLLPTLYLVPRLYGKIEPLLGMAPRTANSTTAGLSPRPSWPVSSALPAPSPLSWPPPPACPSSTGRPSGPRAAPPWPPVWSWPPPWPSSSCW